LTRALRLSGCRWGCRYDAIMSVTGCYWVRLPSTPLGSHLVAFDCTGRALNKVYTEQLHNLAYGSLYVAYSSGAGTVQTRGMESF
jgi:hypothetical protein